MSLDRSLGRMSSVIALLFLGLVALSPGCAAPGTALSPPAQRFLRVPMTRQATDHTCSVAAMQSVLAYYGESIREDLLAQELGTTEDGTTKESMAAYARGKGFEVEMRFGASVEELQRTLDQGKPVLVPFQAWPTTTVDYREDWDDGHWAVAVGYDSENLYFMDPSTLGNYTFIPIREFPDRWHDADMDGETELHHFMLLLSKAKAAYDPKTIQKLE